MAVLYQRPSGVLESVFRDRMDPDTAAYFQISISRRKSNKIRVEVDACLDEEAVGRLVDQDKVRMLRERRQQLQDELEAVPFVDRYRIKPRKSFSATEERFKNKRRTKVVEKGEGDTGKGGKGGGKNGGKGAGKGGGLGGGRGGFGRSSDGSAGGGKNGGGRKSSRSESELARRKELEEEAERMKNQLPDFAKPFLKLRDTVPNPDWTRPAPPLYHGLHMHTKCFQKKEKAAQWCEKVPIYQKYIARAERIEAGVSTTRHVQKRSQLYDGMCQELMWLEGRQKNERKVYAPLKTNCYDCQRYIGAAEGVFFKPDHVDFERNAMTASQPLRRKL